TPPRPPAPPRVARERPKPPEFDHAKFARLTGIVGPEGQLQAWIWVQTTDEMLRLSEGDHIKVGDFEADIKSISRRPNVVVLQAGDEERRIKLGDFLHVEEAAAEGGS